MPFQSRAFIVCSRGDSLTHRTNEMKLFNAIAAAAVFGLGFISISAVDAVELDPKIHKLCTEAKDYAGCVQVRKGDSPNTRLTVDEGKAEIAGFNSCPTGYRYKGNGFCGEVKYKDAGMWFVGSHNSILAGRDSWCKASGLGSDGRLDFSDDTVRASFDKSCLDIDLKPCWQSTCSMEKGPVRKGDRMPIGSMCTATICS